MAVATMTKAKNPAHIQGVAIVSISQPIDRIRNWSPRPSLQSTPSTDCFALITQQAANAAQSHQRVEMVDDLDRAILLSGQLATNSIIASTRCTGFCRT